METGIERVDRPSYDDFRRHYLGRSKPVLIAGALDDWPAMRLWDFDYLGRALHDRQITPLITRNGSWYVDLREGMRVEEMAFSQYRSHFESGDAPPSHYLRLALEGSFASFLEHDYEAPVYCSRRIFMKKNLWVGGKTASGLHYDMMHNLVAQIVGRRRVVLFAPAETKNLYPHPLRSLSWHHSQVRLEEPDLGRFPRLAQAQSIECEIGRGEMLFIPKGWWHHFASLENSVALNFFWVTMRLAPALALARTAWVLNGVRT